MQARSFAELLEQAIRKYQNRAIETAQVIEELIQLARDMRAAEERGGGADEILPGQVHASLLPVLCDVVARPANRSGLPH